MRARTTSRSAIAPPSFLLNLDATPNDGAACGAYGAQAACRHSTPLHACRMHRDETSSQGRASSRCACAMHASCGLCAGGAARARSTLTPQPPWPTRPACSRPWGGTAMRRRCTARYAAAALPSPACSCQQCWLHVPARCCMQVWKEAGPGRCWACCGACKQHPRASAMQAPHAAESCLGSRMECPGVHQQGRRNSSICL